MRGLKHTEPVEIKPRAESHPTWVRGLKPTQWDPSKERIKVAPYVGAWIETVQPICTRELHTSHPTWVRGLKHGKGNHQYTGYWSHPTWVRGLKPLKMALTENLFSRTLRGCVD